MDYGDILVPTDGSEGTSNAVRHGINIADMYGSDLHVVYVVDDSGMDLIPSKSTREDVIEVTDEEGLDAVEEVVGVVEENTSGIETHTSVLRGNPPETIVDYVEENGVDLVSMVRTEERVGGVICWGVSRTR